MVPTFVAYYLIICGRICEKGPLQGQCKHMCTRQNLRNTANSCNRRLLQHWKILYIPYFPAKFETCTAFLRLKRGPNSFTARVGRFGHVRVDRGVTVYLDPPTFWTPRSNNPRINGPGGPNHPSIGGPPWIIGPPVKDSPGQL